MVWLLAAILVALPINFEWVATSWPVVALVKTVVAIMYGQVLALAICAIIALTTVGIEKLLLRLR